MEEKLEYLVKSPSGVMSIRDYLESKIAETGKPRSLAINEVARVMGVTRKSVYMWLQPGHRRIPAINALEKLEG